MNFDLFFTFFKIGLFTFGGGYAMIPLIKEEVVSNNWLSLLEVIDFIGISESTPGPFAVNIATFVGFNVNGVSGAILATLGVVLPSFVIIYLIARYFKDFTKNPYVKNALSGIRPVVIGLIYSSAISIAISIFIKESAFDIYGIIILGIICFLYMKFKKIHPILLISISAILGLIIY